MFVILNVATLIIIQVLTRQISLSYQKFKVLNSYITLLSPNNRVKTFYFTPYQVRVSNSKIFDEMFE